jgi:hypothetical protein
MWLNAEKKGPNIPVQVALLRYPMAGHYNRNFPKNGKQNYMGKLRSVAEVTALVEETKATILELEQYDVLPSNTGRHAPLGMYFAFKLSISQQWKWFFQRKHGAEENEKIDTSNPDSWDNSERVKSSKNIIKDHLRKAMFIYHGWDDTNCKYKDTRTFFELVAQKFPNRYNKAQELTEKEAEAFGKNEKDGKLNLDLKLGLWKIFKLSDNIPAENPETKQTGVGHGRDVDYYRTDEKYAFLRWAYLNVDRFWSQMFVRVRWVDHKCKVNSDESDGEAILCSW